MLTRESVKSFQKKAVLPQSLPHSREEYQDQLMLFTILPM